MKIAQRRVLLITAAMAAVAALAGCGTTSGSTTGSSNAPLTKAQLSGKTVAFIPGTNDPFYISIQCQMEDSAKKYGMTVNTQIPQQFEAAVQTPIVNAVVASKPVAILIAPTDATALQPPLKRAIAAGIPVGLVDTSLSDTSLAFTSIATDSEKGGAQAADALAKLIGEKGKVLVIPFQAGASTSDARTKGFQEEIKKYKDITSLEPQINNNDPAKAASIVSAALAANPDLKGIFATNLFAEEGAATGVRNAHKQGQIKVVGFDAGVEQIAQLKRGDVQALVAQKPAEIGQDAIDQLVAKLTGKSVTKSISTPTVIVTKSNMDDPDIKAAIYKQSCA